MRYNLSVLLASLLLSLTIIPACGPSDEEVIALQQAEDATREKDSIENELVETMDEINRNLDLIRQKQGLISMHNNFEDISKKEEVLRNISIINDLIEDNRRKIDELTIQARKLGKERNAMARIADQTRRRIAAQEAEIDSLKNLLQQESYKVEDLNRRLDEARSDNEALQAETQLLLRGNAEMDKNLNLAWFTYGTSQQLEEKKLIEKKGGIFGLGSKDALSKAFYKNKGTFTELDIRETTSIPVQGKKPKVLTSHPEGSYEWKETEGGEYHQLIIKEPEDFWSTSRFLVVEVR